MPTDDNDDRIKRVDTDPFNHDHEPATDSTTTAPTTTNDPRLAAILSALCTGLGQAYNGEYAKGAVLFGLQVLNVMLLAVGIGFITFPVVWLVAIFDAYEVASNE